MESCSSNLRPGINLFEFEQLMLIFCVYFRCKDPLFTLATPLRTHELDTFSTKGLDMCVFSADQSCKTELEETKELNSNEENNENNGKLEKDVPPSPKRPGWFGKGYAKNKRPRKRRRMR